MCSDTGAKDPAKSAHCIIFTVHNDADRLEHSLSLLTKLTQSHDVRCVIVNDGSTDRSADVLSYFMALHPEFDRSSVTATLHFRQGITAALSEGLKLTQSRYVMFTTPESIPTTADFAALADAAESRQCDIVCSHLSTRHPDLNRMSIARGDFNLHGKLISRDLLLAADAVAPPLLSDIWHHINIIARVFALCTPDRVAVIRRGSSPIPLHSYTPEIKQHLLLAMLIDNWFDEHGLTERFTPFLLQMKFMAKAPLMYTADNRFTLWRNTFAEVNARVLRIPGIPLGERLRAWFLLHTPRQFNAST